MKYVLGNKLFSIYSAKLLFLYTSFITFNHVQQFAQGTPRTFAAALPLKLRPLDTARKTEWPDTPWTYPKRERALR